MSSRLFQEIRENRGLAYAIYSFVSSYLDTGLLGIYFATDLKNLNPSLKTIQTEIIKIIEGNLTESDLSAAKEHLVGSIYLSSESTDNRMMRLAKNEFIFGKYVGYEDLVSELERVTIDDVVEAAGLLDDQARRLLAMFGVEERQLSN